MKKTLVALFALGSVAMGVTLEDAVATGKGTLTLGEATGAITAVAIVDIPALQALMAKDAELAKCTIINFDSTAADIGIQTNYSSYDHDSNGDTAAVINTSGIYGCWNSGGAYDFGMGSGTGFENTNFWTGGVSAAITLTYEYSKGTTGTFTLLDAEGNELKSLGGTFATALKGSGLTFSTIVFDSNIVTKGYVFDQVVTANEAKILAMAAAEAGLSIPEPTTATLSLLALAGLAARRRRR